MADNGKSGDNGGLKTDRNVHQSYVSRIGEQKLSLKSKYRTEEIELPEPPPDPWTNAWRNGNSPNLPDLAANRNPDEDEDIISYLTDLATPPFDGQASECPSRNSVTSAMAISNVYGDDAFEHLSRLYAFTEEILELRSRNTKFFKRVRNLERLKVLQAANQRLENAFLQDKDAAIDICDEDTGFAESLLDAMLSNCRDPPFQKRNVRSAASRQAKSKLEIEKQQATDGISGDAPKVSKWTRVKAAFKWERACTSDAEIADSTTTTTVSLSTTPTRCHRIADIEAHGESKGANEAYDQGTSLDQTSFASLSNAGSYDWSRHNVHNFESQSSKSENGKRGENKNCRRESVDNDIVAMDIEHIKSAELTNEMSQRKPVIRITSEKNRTTYSSSKMDERDTESISKSSTPTLTIRIPSREEDIKCTPSPESHSPLFCNATTPDGNFPQHRKTYQELLTNKNFKRQQSLGDESISRSSKMQRQDSKWNKVRRAFLTNSTLSVPSNLISFAPKQMLLQDETEAPVNCNCNDSVEDIERMTRLNTRADTRRDYQALKEKLGAEFHRKLAEWERLKHMPNLAVAKDTREISSNLLSPRECLLSEERLTPDFKKKLQDWKRVKKVRRGSAPFELQRINRRRLTDWQLWRSPSKSENRGKEVPGFRAKCETGDTVSDGKSHLCEDFVRKMEAWRKMNETSTQDMKSSGRSKSYGLGIATGIDESEFLALERLLSLFNHNAKRGRKGCDVQQLDECFVGDTRPCTDGIQSENNAKEVLVRTSVGSYRFEGISREFTRKLYDWEKYRGISPTSSTFRLLGPAYTPLEKETTNETSTANPSLTRAEADVPVLIKPVALKRSKSVGSLLEGTTEREFFLRRSNSLQSPGFSINSRFTFDDCVSNLTASIDPQTTRGIAEDIMDDSEPEAMIVDIEDVIEETASPLERVQPRQTPVYSVAASETTSIAVPLGTVASSHEPSPVFLIEMEDCADTAHWTPEVCNQRKSFSSEDSASMEHYEMASRNCSKCDDTESEHWSVANSLNESTCTMNDSTDRLHPEFDKISVKSSGSNCSMGLVSKQHAVEKSTTTAKKTSINFGREICGDVSVDDENRIETIGREHSPNAQLKLARCRHNQDIPAVEGVEREDDNRKILAEFPSKRENEYEEVIANRENDNYTLTSIHRIGNRTKERIETSSTTDRLDKVAFDENFSYALRSGGTSTRLEDNYGVIRGEEHRACRGPDLFKLTRNSRDPSKIYEYWSREEQGKGSNEIVTSVHSMEGASCQVSGTVENVSTFLVLRATNSCTRENHCEPTIRTTAYTVAPCTEERCFQRIVVNERNLNKIVVPTASAGSREDTKTSKDTAGPSAAENSKDERQSKANRGAQVNQEENCKKQSSGSPGRNVFIKTKRMIFAPFRRSDERSSCKKESNALEQDHLLPTKSKSKSRSASPKVNRQDALLRMSLSLPWPLRSSSKDRESKEIVVEKSEKEKQTLVGTQNFEQCDSVRETETSSIEKRNVCRVSMKSETPVLRNRRSSFELTTKRDEFQHSVEAKNQCASMTGQARPSNEQHSRSSFRISLPTLKGADETSGATSLSKFEPSASDLIYKLNILSNAVAKRDGRANTIAEDAPLETHSLRIRRAKEDFLSRRGGPLCHSALDPPPTKAETFRKMSPRRCEEILYDRKKLAIKRAQDLNENLSSVAATKESSNNSTAYRAERIKSASAGMINVDPDTFERLTETNRGCESLPRSISKQRQSVGPLAKIVGRLKFARLIRGREAEEEKSTISKLCRQSLLIDLRNDFEKCWEAGSQRKLSRVERADKVKKGETED